MQQIRWILIWTYRMITTCCCVTGGLLTLMYLMCVDFRCFNRRITQYFARRRQQGVVCSAGVRCTLLLASHIIFVYLWEELTMYTHYCLNDMSLCIPLQWRVTVAGRHLHPNVMLPGYDSTTWFRMGCLPWQLLKWVLFVTLINKACWRTIYVYIYIYMSLWR